DPQCPYAAQSIAQIENYCKDNGVPVEFRLVDTLEKAKALPCVFNNWAVFYRGAFQTVNLLDTAALKRILK
ncbi:MAG: YoaP domain-containing protein, partial [Christensenellales bacterium]